MKGPKKSKNTLRQDPALETRLGNGVKPSRRGSRPKPGARPKKEENVHTHRRFRSFQTAYSIQHELKNYPTMGKKIVTKKKGNVPILLGGATLPSSFLVPGDICSEC